MSNKNTTQETYLKRTTFKITSKCTLKCKLCLAYIPYYKNPKDLSYENAKKILARFFSLVDKIGTFSITGGEPFINKDFANIINETFNYINQIEQTVDIVTNGTLLPSEDLLKTLKAHKQRMRVIISNYGKLSRNIDKLIQILKENDINFRIEEYSDEKNLKYGGWLDYRDHSLKHSTRKDVIQQAKDCFFRQGRYYEINEGEFHLCSRSFYRMMTGIIPKNQDQYIDLLNPTNSIEDDRHKLLEMDKLVYLDSCAYCDGNKANSKRYKPAEQLP